MPTTDENDKYDEEQRRLEADQAHWWNMIFSCFGWIALAILVAALIIMITR